MSVSFTNKVYKRKKLEFYDQLITTLCFMPKKQHLSTCVRAHHEMFVVDFMTLTNSKCEKGANGF